MIVVVSADIPPTAPPLLMVPTAVLLLLHVPPVLASESVVVEPTQTVDAPAMGSGSGLTVITLVVVATPQPLVTVYTIVSTPAVTPVTIPEASTVATRVLVLLHTPPVTEPVTVMVLPAHTAVGPDIVPAVGNGFTVITVVLIHPVGNV